MSLKDAERNLKGLGKLIARNAPGPKHLVLGFHETVRPVLPIWIAIAFLLLFGEPFVHWLTHR